MELKPWLWGLIDNLTAANLIKGTSIEHRNRLSLILLDSCLEIAFKTYITNVLKIKINDDLKKKLKQRENLHKFIKPKTKELFDDDVWDNIDFYYGLRCDLYHEESTKTLSDKSLNDFHELVEFVIDSLFDVNSKDYVKNTDDILKITKKEIEEIKKIPINTIQERINVIVVSVKESPPSEAKDIQEYLKKLGYKGHIAIGDINKNLRNWYKHLFYYDSAKGKWFLSDEGERRYSKIANNINI